MPRGAEKRERNQRKYHGVQARDQRSAGDASVAQDLRNIDGGDAHAGEHVADDALTRERPKAPQEANLHWIDLFWPSVTVELGQSPRFPLHCEQSTERLWIR